MASVKSDRASLGLAFFTWFALYVWQTQLAARGQVARHREIGLAAFALTGAMIPLGVWMAQRAAEIRFSAGAARSYEFTWFNLVDITLFAGLMAASILLVTRQKEWRQRLTFVRPCAWRCRRPVDGRSGSRCLLCRSTYSSA